MDFVCAQCKISFKRKGSKGKFCSRSCSVSYNNYIRHQDPEWSRRRKEKLSKILKGRTYPERRMPLLKSVCMMCEDTFVNNRSHLRKTCSDRCRIASTRLSGQASAKSRVLRSKDEIRLFELCLNHFTNVDHNQIIINGWDADIVIHDIKTAVLWNGPWHYREMNLSNHNLAQVKTRDRLKISVLQQAGWRVIVFEDRYYTPETAFSELVGPADPDTAP